MGLLLVRSEVYASTGALKSMPMIRPHLLRADEQTIGPDIPISNFTANGSGSYEHENNSGNKEHAFMETKHQRERLVGILEHDQIMAYTQNLQHAFKRSSKFTHSVLFLKQLFSKNPFLKYFALRYSQRIKIVDHLEKSATRWNLLRKDKAMAAEEAMATIALGHVYSMGRSLKNRGEYNQQKQDLLQELRAVNAGGHALDLILGNRSKPIFTWTSSLWKNPLATLSNVVKGALNESFEGVFGIPQREVKNACFSFGYRFNSIAPYTSILPGGIFGSVLKSLARSFMLVYYPVYSSFKGIFALMISVICKTGVLAATKKLFGTIANVTRLGLRGLHILFRRFALRGDPVAWPIMQDLLRNTAPAMITLLFQLYAINIEDITKRGKRVSHALSAGNASWNYADGLWIGAFDFGRAFINVIQTYLRRAESFVDYCSNKNAESQKFAETASMTDTQTISAESLEEPEASGQFAEPLVDEDLLKAFEAIVSPSSMTSSRDEVERSNVRDIDVSKRVNVAVSSHNLKNCGESHRLNTVQLDTWVCLSASCYNSFHFFVQCQKYKKFVSSFSRNRLSHVERFVIQTIKVLKYDYKFFQRYIGEMMSIFYEMAYGLLNADVANVLSDKMSLDTMRERIHTALAKFQVYREVSSEIQSSSLPRTLFREPWFTRSARDLAHGFFEKDSKTSTAARDRAAFKLLTAGANNLHKSVNSLFREFLTARLMIARLEGHSSVKTIQDFIALCNPQLGIPDINLCGKVVTSEVDPAAFVKEALFALHAPMTTSADDIAFHNDSKLGNVFTSWSGTGLSEQNRAVAEGASDRAAMENFILHLREAVQSRLTFSRFEFADNFTRLVLHDTNGRSVNFIPDNEDDVKALAGQKTTPQRSSRPSPLDTNCWFSVTEANKGTLKFVTMDAKELETSIEGLAVPAEGIPTYEIPGQVMYRDRREELRSIINEPSAVRDVIVAKFVDQSGRAAAEMMANLLYILHSRTPSFSSHSPSVFLQNIMPKMFFDSFQALSVASKSRKSASVVLEGRLYSFALSFDNLKSIFLGAVNRLILRMHSLDSRDMVSVFMMTVAVMAYQRVQKHRTGKTLVMNMFLRDVLHLQRANQLGRLLEEAPHCAWLEKQEGLPQEEFVIKCAALRFLKIGSLKIEDAEVVNVRNYLAEFFNILNGLRGKTRWMDFLNIRTFSAEADLYAETAAQYSYEKLEGQLRDEETHEQIGGVLGSTNSNLHMALGGARKYLHDKRDTLTALRSYAENIKKLPPSLRKSLEDFFSSCYGKLRRFLGAKQFTWFKSIRPHVLHASSFFAAVAGAEGLVFPNPAVLRGNFISASDLTEYGQLQLAFEELALILSDARSMQNVISELRSIPVQTVEAKEEYDKLKARVDELPPETVETATGWSLRYMNDGKGGLEIAIGLLALKSGNEGQLNKALHLSLANVEVLRFLNSALDVAQVLEYLPSATPEELQKLRLSLGEFKATVHAEPQTTALNTKAQYSVRQGVDNLVSFFSSFMLCVQSNEETLSTHCRNLLKPPHILADESLCSKTVDDWVILCFILIKLEKRGPIPEEIAPMELVKAAFVDGKSVESHLHDLVNSGLPSDFRLQVANSINPFLRGLLIFFMGHQLGDVGAAQLLSVDLPTGVISFSFTHVYEFTSAEPEHGGTPAYVFRKLARIAFGAESLEESKPIKIANTSISYPQSLDDWYAFVDLEKLEALTSQKIKADALAEISAWSRFMDLVDFFFAMRQSSLIAPQTMVASASDALLKDDSITFLERVGMIVFISDFHKLAETAKIDCLQDAMKNIVTYVPLQIREKHLYKYDCFETKLSEDMAASNAAKTATDEFVARAIEAIEAAYIVKAKELFNKVMSKPDQSELAIKRAMQFSQHVPVSEFGGKVAKEIVEIVFRHGTWDNLLAGLQRLRDIEWQFHTPLRKRVINEKTRPKFFNPIILATDCLSFMLAGRYTRLRLPKPLLLKRGAAWAKLIVRRLLPSCLWLSDVPLATSLRSDVLGWGAVG
ncbi:uncharacterized protein LOC34622828 [Cyclospora cayetanensis]|uniref:Uncharacterized protein LOC34622828 n=1 Tax=Cyclospora cayetanensis TaxID=88456 RepID=A0A6P6RXS2_9EIME|nr:uncharacterized protein LOC34622828 [Cyclospora cayetanensis]